MIAKENIDALIQGKGNVLSPDGEKIGGIGQVYLDDDTGEPSWVTVKTGLFGLRESFVPLEGAWLRGVDLIVQYGKDQVKDAPLVDPDGHPEPDEEARLYQHYRLRGGTRTYTDAIDAGGSRGDIDGPVENDYEYEDAPGAPGRDFPGQAADNARAGKQLNAGPEGQDTGRARLRKYVVTENVTGTVPVSHQGAAAGHEPVPGDETLDQELRQENTDAGSDDERRP